MTRTVAYDAIGNITSKSDVGLYTYDPARVHAVASIVPGTTGTVTASYSYDGNGNLLSGNGRTVTWTSFDMVEEVTQGTNSLAFTYDSERNRLKQASSDGSTKYYLNDPISGIMAEKIVGASLSVTWNDYIMVGAEMVALKVSGAATQTRYFHKDHLGSITALTDETGTVVESNSFDAWGHRRAATGPADPLYPGLSLTSQITRGYTGHEQLDQVGLVHMNGRIYDPVIGKMMSADPTVPNPIDGQSYNRYSYVYNNPLSLTDPTGFMGVDKDERGFPKGEPAHKATDFKSHAEYAAAGDLSEYLGRPIATRAEFLSELNAIADRIRRDILTRNQIACGPKCKDVAPTGYIHWKDEFDLDQWEWSNRWIDGRWVDMTSGRANPTISPLDFIGPGGPAVATLRGLIAKATISRIEGTIVQQVGKTTVYRSISTTTDEVQYVGITDRYAQRALAHLREKGIEIEKVMSGLARSDARAVEQALIEMHGLSKLGGTLMNKINSIAASNPAFASQLQRGRELLDKIGY